MKTQQQLFCFLGLIVLTTAVNADESNFGKKIASTNQVIEALNPAAANPDVIPDDNDYEGDIKQSSHDRNISMGNLAAPKAKSKASVKKPYTPGTETALSMEIIFGYKSAELTASGKDQLKPVGEALASEKLKNMGFVVEGHTDAIGGYAYNINLSEERAASVKRFLVDTYDIEPSHIKIVGKGKNDLLDANNPDSEVNRRVRIVAVRQLY